MAVKLRLQRFGAHKTPYYRIVASESNRSRDGKFLDILGTYEPLQGKVSVDSEKVQKWIGMVHNQQILLKVYLRSIAY
jgi:small subunit ribosomal protein S16